MLLKLYTRIYKNKYWKYIYIYIFLYILKDILNKDTLQLHHRSINKKHNTDGVDEHSWQSFSEDAGRTTTHEVFIAEYHN